MPKITIDNREVEVKSGETILAAAAKLGIEIPTMCFLKDYKASTSCMVCMVRVNSKDEFVPACGMIAEDGMQVESNSSEVHEARKIALELLLSDHVGDCVGPCQMGCPAGMNIPLMIRQIAAGEFRKAIVTVKKDIALPAVLGRICTKPCEKVCRRGSFDSAVSICMLKRYVADVDLRSPVPYLPECEVKRNKKVAVIGAGPAGLSAAYYLLQKGLDCTIYDEYEKAGGTLRYGAAESEFDRDVLDAEISVIEKLGAEFKFKSQITNIAELRKDFDAILLASGQIEGTEKLYCDLETKDNCIVINRKTYETALPGVFAAGDVVRKRRLVVRAVADGKEVVVSIEQFLSGVAVTGPARDFNSRIGKVKDGEIENFMADISRAGRQLPLRQGQGFTEKQAREEAGRCMHCDCRKADNCKLRKFSRQYEAGASRYKDVRRVFVQQLKHPDVIYEPEKCISCGLCIQIAEKCGEELGLTFIGRGFDVRVAVPFDKSLAQGLKQAANLCVEACPTGALAFK